MLVMSIVSSITCDVVLRIYFRKPSCGQKVFEPQVISKIRCCHVEDVRGMKNAIVYPTLVSNMRFINFTVSMVGTYTLLSDEATPVFFRMPKYLSHVKLLTHIYHKEWRPRKTQIIGTLSLG